MTNQQILDIYTANIGTSHAAALRAIWNAGWYQGKSITPAATSPEKSGDAAKPVAVLKIRKV